MLEFFKRLKKSPITQAPEEKKPEKVKVIFETLNELFSGIEPATYEINPVELTIGRGSFCHKCRVTKIVDENGRFDCYCISTMVSDGHKWMDSDGYGMEPDEYAYAIIGPDSAGWGKILYYEGDAGFEQVETEYYKKVNFMRKRNNN